MKRTISMILLVASILIILVGCNSPIFSGKQDESNVDNQSYHLNEKEMTTLNKVDSSGVTIIYNNARNIIIFDYRKAQKQDIKFENLDKRKTQEITINGKTQKVWGNCIDIIGLLNNHDKTTIFVSEGFNIIQYELHDSQEPKREVITDKTWDDIMKPYLNDIHK